MCHRETSVGYLWVPWEELFLGVIATKSCIKQSLKVISHSISVVVWRKLTFKLKSLIGNVLEECVIDVRSQGLWFPVFVNLAVVIDET